MTGADNTKDLHPSGETFTRAAVRTLVVLMAMCGILMPAFAADFVGRTVYFEDFEKQGSGFENAEFIDQYMRFGELKEAQVSTDQALSGQYDVVCHGHDHIANVERIGHTLLINPGEVMGRFGKSTYALYDTEAGEAVLREV